METSELKKMKGRLIALLTDPSQKSGLVGHDEPMSEHLGKWTRMPLVSGQSDIESADSFKFFLKDSAVVYRHKNRIRFSAGARRDFVPVNAACNGLFYGSRYAVLVSVGEDKVYDPVVKKEQWSFPYVKFDILPWQVTEATV